MEARRSHHGQKGRLDEKPRSASTQEIADGAALAALTSQPRAPVLITEGRRVDRRPSVSGADLGGALRGDCQRLSPLDLLAYGTRFLDPLPQGLRPFREHHHPEAPEPAQMLASE